MKNIVPMAKVDATTDYGLLVLYGGGFGVTHIRTWIKWCQPENFLCHSSSVLFCAMLNGRECRAAVSQEMQSLNKAANAIIRCISLASNSR